MGHRFILVIADRFTKRTQVVPLKRTNSLDVAKAFSSHLVFKYGARKEVLSDNGPQFASKLHQNTCRVLGVTNTFTSAYHPQKTGQVERFNQSIAAMLRCYVSDHRRNWDEFAEPLAHAYNLHVYQPTGTRPFDFVLSHPALEFTLQNGLEEEVDVVPSDSATAQDRVDFSQRMETVITAAEGPLAETQAR